MSITKLLATRGGTEKLGPYIREIVYGGNDGIVTLITLPRLDKTQLSSAWFTALDGLGTSVRCDPIERQALPLWIAQRLKAQGQEVEAGEAGQRTLAFFADRVEGNLLAAHQEIQKLALLYPPGELGFAQVESAVLNVARYDVFKLSEAVLAGQAARVQRMLDGLQAEGEAEVLVHYTLAEDIRALKRVKDSMAAGRPLPMALREQRIWGVKERLTLEKTADQAQTAWRTEREQNAMFGDRDQQSSGQSYGAASASTTSYQTNRDR